MFKLGEYNEFEAKEISSYLRKAGMKVDLRPYIEADVEEEEFLEGRFSEIRGEIKDEDYAAEIEQYLNALRKVIKEKPTEKNFGEKYISELFPTLEERLDAISEHTSSLEPDEDEISGCEPGEESPSISPSDELPHEHVGCDAGQTDDSREAADLSSEEMEKRQEEILELADMVVKCSRAKQFALSVLSMNDVKADDFLEGNLDDPIVAVPVDLDDYAEDHPDAMKVLSVYMDKSYELYVDEFSAFMSEGLDDEFLENYVEESIKIRSMDLLLGELIENHSSEKMDFEDFMDECVFSSETKGSIFRVHGEPVAEDLAKILEKNGLLKIKGDVIKWKK